MKSFGTVFVIAIALLLTQGCANARHAHQLTLQNCHTQDDVSTHFGLPAEEIHGQTTEWIYSLATHRDSVTGRAFVKVADSAHTGRELKYYKYLEFTFDSRGNVIGYTSNVADPVAAYINKGNNITVWSVIGATLFLAVVVYIDAVTKSDISF